MWEVVINAYGTLAKVGAANGNRSRQDIHRRKTKGLPIPAEWCAQIERDTQIPKHVLRPDIFEAPKEVM